LKRIVLFGGAGLLVALLVCLGINIYLYRLANEYYRQLREVRLDPLDLDSYPVEADQLALTNPQRLTFVFFGDSRAQFWPTPEGLEHIEFMNRGIGAQTSSQVAERFSRHLLPLDPDLILLQVCVNELTSIPLFPERKDQIIAGCETNITAVIDRAQETGAILILTTVFPVGEPSLLRLPVWSDEIPAAIEEVNRFIRAQAAEDVLILDTFALLVNEQGRLRDEYRVDELHLNSAGYEVLNTALVALMAEIAA
jgi:lysophospholipase L1-like esterase